MKRLICLILCLALLPSFSLAQSVEDSLIIGMVSTRTTQVTPLIPQERDIMSLYALMYESLVTIDDNGLPQPLLCESWTETGGGKTWTFKLRENITFSDGTPLTANDVAECGNFILSLSKDELAEDNGFYANIRYMVSSFKARDEHTVEVKAARPYYGLLYSMTFPVVPASQIYSANPVGTGPYLMTGFEAGSHMLLNANPKWWQMQPPTSMAAWIPCSPAPSLPRSTAAATRRFPSAIPRASWRCSCSTTASAPSRWTTSTSARPSAMPSTRISSPRTCTWA